MSSAIKQSSHASVASPAPQDAYRIILLRGKGAEVLLTGDVAPLDLPCVSIPSGERSVEHLTGEVRRVYGIPALCLFTLNSFTTTAEGPNPLYQVMETRTGTMGTVCEASKPIRWLPIRSAVNRTSTNGQDVEALTETQRQIKEFEDEGAGAPFGRPGWVDDLMSWVQSVAPPGLRVCGPLRQLNGSPTFALLRIQTDAQALWFKAVGSPNLHELPVSVTLSSLFPDFVPHVLAAHPLWHGWLMKEVEGTALDETTGNKAWEQAAESLAELQLASIGHADKLLLAGCKDLRAPSLLRLVDPLVERVSLLMDLQPKSPPPILSRSELLDLGKQIRYALADLAELSVPDALGHLDFNPGNILSSPDRPVFLDWAEAYVGHPFFTLQYLREHLRRTHPGNFALERRLVIAYEERWGSIIPARDVFITQKFMPLLAVFAYASAIPKWQASATLLEPATAAYLRSLARRMYTEMHKLRSWRQSCH
jgi:hypothetical protein